MLIVLDMMREAEDREDGGEAEDHDSSDDIDDPERHNDKI